MLNRLLFLAALISISLSSVLYRDEYGNLVRYEGRDDQLNVYQRPNRPPLDTLYSHSNRRQPSFNDYYGRKQLDAYFQQLERDAKGWAYGKNKKNRQETVELGTPLKNETSKRKDNTANVKVTPEDSTKSKKVEIATKDATKEKPQKLDDAKKKKDAVQKKKYVDSLFDDDEDLIQKKEIKKEHELMKTVSKDEKKKDFNQPQSSKDVPQEKKKERNDPQSNIKIIKLNDGQKYKKIDHMFKDLFVKDQLPAAKTQDSRVSTRTDNLLSDSQQKLYDEYRKMLDEKFSRMEHNTRMRVSPYQRGDVMRGGIQARYDSQRRLMPTRYDNLLPNHQQQLHDQYRQMLAERLDTPHNRMLFNQRSSGYDRRFQDYAPRYEVKQDRENLFDEYRRKLTERFQQQQQQQRGDYPQPIRQYHGDYQAYRPRQSEERNFRFNTITQQ